jgi:hypothetical protein
LGITRYSLWAVAQYPRNSTIIQRCVRVDAT